MKEELKTLKDFKKKLNTLTKWEYYSERDLLEELKAEAVKDYKDDEQMYPNIFNTIEQQNAVRKYIKWKNNLTKEDLK